MAEEKFYDAEKLSEISLMNNLIQDREVLLSLYLDAVKQQNKVPALKFTLEYVEMNLENSFERAFESFKLVEEINDDQHLTRKIKIQLKIAETSGELDTIYKEIKRFKLKLLELNKPIKFEFIEILISKYFKKDLDLKILELAYTLSTGNLKLVEKNIQELIQEIFQDHKCKNKKDKLLMLGKILESQDGKKHLELYQNYCFLFCFGIREKKDYKKIIELLILKQQFEYQVLVLYLIDHLNLFDIATIFAKTIKIKEDFNFIYVSKNYPNLKKYFGVQKKTSIDDSRPHEMKWDRCEEEFLGIVKDLDNQGLSSFQMEINTEEFKIINSLKFQELNEEQLINLASSFMQSEYFKAVQFALDLALKFDLSHEKYLKVLYLKSLASFKLGEFRSVLDLGIEALSKENNENDILNFLYLIGESYYFLDKRTEALVTFKKILNINENFRNVIQRIRELDEV